MLKFVFGFVTKPFQKSVSPMKLARSVKFVTSLCFALVYGGPSSNSLSLFVSGPVKKAAHSI